MNISDIEKKWFGFYLSMAKQYGQFSRDERLKVGCIIVDEEFSKVLSVGYNGWEKGGPNKPDSNKPGETGAIHAEINCAIKMDNKKLYPNSYMFCTYSPCRVCARVIINLGCISTFIYSEKYRDFSGLDILLNSGIRVIQA